MSHAFMKGNGLTIPVCMPVCHLVCPQIGKGIPAQVAVSGPERSCYKCGLMYVDLLLQFNGKTSF